MSEYVKDGPYLLQMAYYLGPQDFQRWLGEQLTKARDEGYALGFRHGRAECEGVA